MSKLTETQHRALKSLAERTGEAVIDRYGKAVSAGQRLKFGADTWLRLMTLGVIAPAGTNRFALTEAGKKAVGYVPNHLHAPTVAATNPAVSGNESEAVP